MPLLLIAFPFLEFWTLLEVSARAGALATMGYIVSMISSKTRAMCSLDTAEKT